MALSPKEYYKYLNIASNGGFTGREAEIEEQFNSEKSIQDILMWKSQEKAQRRKFTKTTPKIGSMNKRRFK